MMAARLFPRSLLAASLLALLALPVVPVLTAQAQDSPPKPRKVASVEGITEYVLENNGLRILLFPDESASKVTVNMTVLVGSRHEGYGETGMAHLLEHMLFKGTPSHQNIPKLLRDRGASFNGTTWLDRTNYYETLDASDANLEFAIRLEADRLIHSYVKREDLLSEMTVVRNEFEMGENNPQYILSQRMVAIAYEWHNYGKSTIGNRSDIERVPIEKLQAFYRKFYQPDNVLLIVAGKFEPAKALAYVGKYFGVHKKPRRQLDNTYTDEPPQDGERIVELRRVGSVGVVGAVYHIPAGAHEDMAPLDVLSEVLQMEPSGRLYKALVEEGKKATSVSANSLSLHDPGYLEVIVQVDKKASIEDTRKAMLDIIDKACQGPIDKEEVERAKRKLKSQHDRLMTMSNVVGTQLSEWAAMGDWRLMFLHRDRVARVTPEDVQRVARRYLLASNRTVGMFYPTEHPKRSIIPPTPDVETLVKSYQSKETIAQGETFEPTLANIEKRTEFTRLGNGVRVALVPHKTRGERVTLQLTLHYGNPESLKNQGRAAQILGSLLRQGTRKHDRQQLQDILDRLQAQLNVSGSVGQLSCSVSCKRKDLATVLGLLTEVLREPSFPPREFDVLKRQTRGDLEEERTEPQQLAQRALQRRLSPYPADDVRYVPTTDESLERLDKVTLEQVRKLYTEQVSGEHGELVVAGDFDPKETLAIMEKALAGWKSEVAYERIKRPVPANIKPERLTIETPDKENAVYLAGMLLPLRDTDPDNAALKVGNYLFGGGPLSSRLADRVRQKEGLSYGVGSVFRADAQDPRAQVLLYAICNPANMEKVDRAILEEMERLLKDGAQDKEVEETKKAYLATLKQQRSTDQMLAGQLQNELEAGRKLENLIDQEKRIKSLTVEEVNSALHRHFDPKKLVIIRAGDFRNKAGKKQ